MQDFTLKNFQDMFGSEVSCNGHAFFWADSEMVEKHVAEDKVVSGGNLQRLAEYELEFARYQESKKASKKTVWPIVDLSQNCRVRSSFTDTVPSPLTHSVLYSMEAKRAMIPVELFALMAWPVAGLMRMETGNTQKKAEESEFPWEESVFEGLALRDVNRLIGNSMHCRVAGLFISFGLMTTKWSSGTP